MISALCNLIAPYIMPVIVVVGIVNAIIFFIVRSKINNLHTLVQSWTYYGFHGEGTDDVKKLVESSDSAALWYTLYANISAIFPLMGIFGTVCALLNSSPGSGVTDNFFVALDTTIMGLFFAILCKVADSVISSKLDRALDEADYQIHKLSQETRISYARTET